MTNKTKCFQTTLPTWPIGKQIRDYFIFIFMIFCLTDDLPQKDVRVWLVTNFFSTENKHFQGENQRPCEIQHEAWTPYNSNLQMQGIKVNC